MKACLENSLLANLQERPLISYACPHDAWFVRKLVLGIENCFGRRQVQKLYDELKANPFEVRSFFRNAIKKTDIDLRYDESKLAKLPKIGPLVMVANHPYGVMDGMILCHLAAQARGNFRILINAMLYRDRDLAPYFLPVDFTPGKAALKNNLLMSKYAQEAIRADIPVLIFPSGFVSTANKLGFGKVVDAPWTTFAAKLITESQASVIPVFFHGQNSRGFHIASQLYEPLRMALLIREARAKFGKRIDVEIGDTIASEQLNAIVGRKELTQYLYQSVQDLGTVAHRQCTDRRLEKTLEIFTG